ncbi:MAG: YncE family protein [Candidatus Aegiribacteria sp.]|nr:YncE family protein [Candidatus Aegiribacteria sp.]
MKTVLNVTVTVAFVLLFACGDSTGPSGPDVSPSTLSVSFTGTTAKIGSNVAPEASTVALLSSSQNSTGPKSSCILTASWTICSDQGFHSYVLYRSETSGISSDTSSAEILTEVTSVNTSLYLDTDVTWETEYFYALRTTDSDNNGVWSNEVSITTPQVDAPTPSVLSESDVSWYYVDLSWTKCPETNFESYRLYRSMIPNIEDDSTLADLMCDVSWSFDTTYTDSAISASSTYYYALLTTNDANVSSWSNEITVNTSSNIPDSLVSTVNVGLYPWDICSLPSGEYLYVTNRGDDNVSVIRTSDNTVTGTVNVCGTPYGICSLPSGDYVYVTNWGSDNVSVIRTSDNSVIATIDTGDRPVGICTLPSGEYVYVTNRGDNNVSVIRTSDNSVVDTIAVGTDPYRMCALPSGDYIYVTNWSSNNVSVIRTSDNSIVDTIDMYSNPIGICALPSGEYLYVSNYANDVVTVIRTSDNSFVKNVTVGNGPWGICPHPSGEYLYVANSTDNTLSLFRVSDNTVIATIWSVGTNPSSVCSLPSGDAIYTANYLDGTVSMIE